jgi:predicted  nucleic acid-binding Zn-ribbon protein
MSDELLELASKRIAELRQASVDLIRRDRFGAAVKRSGDADLLDKLSAEIERLREELAAANSEIGGLESLVEDLQEDLYGEDCE